MILAPLEHPVGQTPPTAPQGLVDILWPQPASIGEQVGGILAHHAQSQGIWWLFALGLLGTTGLLLVRLWRDRRGILLRWRLNRLNHLLDRSAARPPHTERIASALMWALARYFDMTPAVQRAALPDDWRPLIHTLDSLRFGPTPLRADDLRDILQAMRTQIRHPGKNPS